MQAYGFGPVVEESEVLLHGAHSDQERMRETSIYSMVEYLWHTVMEVAASK